MEGWVKLHRKIATWQWASSPNHMSLFMQLLLRANHKETKWRMETIAPGQLLTGRKQLMDWTGLTERQIRKCLDDLEFTREIVRKRSAKYSIITIANWETYQSDDRQRSAQGPFNVQQRSTSKNAKNVKNEKNNTNPALFQVEDLHLEEDMTIDQKASNVLTLFNALTFKNFRPVPGNMKHINARVNEGYSLEDFKKVIQMKYDEWINDPKFAHCVRPETILGNKFDSYLQAASNTHLKEIEDNKLIAEFFPGFSA